MPIDQEGEELVHIPTSLLLTTDRISQQFVERHSRVSVHGLLASFLSNDITVDLEHLDLWRATWPTRTDFAKSMPILLPDRLRRPSRLDTSEDPFPVLPPAICGAWAMSESKIMSSASYISLVAKQEAKIQRDWNAVQSILPGASFQTFEYNWLIVNTRAFYYDLPLRLKPKTNEERMILCPFVDYFNHADEGVRGPDRAADKY